MRLKFYLLIVFILISAMILSLCIQERTVEKKFTPPTPLREKPTPTPLEKTVKKEKPIDGECLNCHYNAKRKYVPQADTIAGHLDASDYCVYCHVKNAANLSKDDLITEIHLLHGNLYNNCSVCHKSDISIKPKCADCHASNPLKPSNGDVFVIHTPRHVGCKGCHGDDFLRIHQYKKLFPEEFSFPE